MLKAFLEKMEPLEIYTLIVCLLVYVLLAGLGTYVVIIVTKLTLKLIRSGANDEDIIAEYEKYKDKKKNCALDCISSIFLCVVFSVAFIFSAYAGCTQNTYFEDLPTFKVVQSSSMSTKNEKNQYLFDNNLDNQFQTFDLILSYQPPKEEDLKIYDIVIYEIDGIEVIHRIVNIEEPNANHPNERWFLLQGDAISKSDRFPVKYEQIKGIYRNERIPFIGSFISFLQSPAGYMCIILVALAIIATPILDKKLNEEKKKRLLLLGIITETKTETSIEVNVVEQNAVAVEPIPELENNITADVTEEVAVTDFVETEEEQLLQLNLKDINDCKTFREKLENSLPAVKSRYNYVLSYISRAQGISAKETVDYVTFKKGDAYACRMLFRGKTLCILLSLPAEDYEGTKYLFTNITRSKVYPEFFMRLKLSSDRQAKWTCELLSDLFARLGCKLLDYPAEIPYDVDPAVFELLEEVVDTVETVETVENVEVTETSPFAHLQGKTDDRTFKERLDQSSEQVKNRYQTITNLLYRIDGVRVIDAKKSETFKKASTPITKLTIKGKTLNAYLGLNPKDYKDTKYVFTDVSDVKKYQSYAMRIKATSDRQAIWTCELIKDIVAKNKFTLTELPVIKEKKEFSFADLKKKKVKGFKYRLRTSPIAKERYDKIKAELLKIDGVRVIEGKSSVTYKLKARPIVKFAMRGKTLNAYLGLNPSEYLDTKYIFTDVSNINAYANYPMRVKVTSDRQVKWVIIYPLPVFLGS